MLARATIYACKWRKRWETRNCNLCLVLARVLRTERLLQEACSARHREMQGGKNLKEQDE